jgi:hypothetical protein
MRWLQLVPFRANREPEFDAMVLLACASRKCRFTHGTNLMSHVLGPSDDPSLLELDEALDTTSPRRSSGFDSRLPKIRLEVVQELINDGYYRINTDLRAQRTLGQIFDQLTFRIVPQAALPDSVLFQQLLDHDQRPSGLAVAAMLGSPLAKAQTTAPAAAVASSIPAHPYDRAEPSLYDSYLNTLRALFLLPEPEAPAFLRSEAWTAKSTQTALAGWVQMRHTFTLQAKMSVFYRGLVIVPPGFVEPNTEFYARLRQLIVRSKRLLGEYSTFLADQHIEADQLRDLADFLVAKGLTAPDSSPAAIRQLNNSDSDRYFEAEMRGLDDPDLPWARRERSAEEFRMRIRQMHKELTAKAERMENGQDPLPVYESSLRARWQNLSSLVSRLETLAHKQLRNQLWTEEETAFLKSYGEQLGLIHGYFGNSWMSPRDDAPRWAEVSGLPENGKFLAAGVGRPREFYVLYPWNGTEVLCVGSVMQYYEYETAERLTDDAWRALLDSPDAPPLPTWLQPYAPPPAAPRADHD